MPSVSLILVEGECGRSPQKGSFTQQVHVDSSVYVGKLNLPFLT